MRGTRARRGRPRLAITAALVLALCSVVAGCASDSPRSAPLSLTVDRSAGARLRPGFLGLSLEFRAVRAYTGADASAVNPVFVQLIRNLTPGQAPSLRIGGGSTDATWWPVPGAALPPDIKYALTAGWLRTTRALAQVLGARMILGVNLAMNRPGLAAVEARELLAGVGRSNVAALELGNEPDIYSLFPQHRGPNGREIHARSRAYYVPAFTRDFSQLRRVLPPAPIAGPAFGNVGWMSKLPQFLAAEPGLGMVTFHRYPTSCFAARKSPKYPSIFNLLSDNATTGLAASVVPFVKIAHAHGLPLRIDEFNSVACSGLRGVSDTFASALWMLDALFAMAQAGVDGVNVHTLPGARYQPFGFTHHAKRWTAHVYPEYFGMLMFARAAPPASRLVPVRGSAGPRVKLWATRAPNGVIRVVLINLGTSAARIALGRPAGAGRWATAERLAAPGLKAQSGITLGGQTFGSSTSTGLLSGRPATLRIGLTSGRYDMTLPPTSATLLTL